MSYSGGGQRDAFTNVATKVYKTKKKGVNAKRKRVPRNQTTLFGVIEALMGHPIAVELKDDSVVDGTLNEVMYPDGDMTLSKVTYTNSRDGTSKPIETMFVKGNRVRYIVFPDHLNVKKVLKIQEDRKISAANFYGRKKRS
jgi:small nuclear ribonucleoprotein (snRNP)-like protein|eukprot:g1815.t1